MGAVDRIGYDIDRVTALRARVRAACADLDDLRSGDPAAAGAIVEVGRLRRVLEDLWLPPLDAIVASDPLGSSGSSATLWSTLLPGPLLVGALVSLADELPTTSAGHADLDALLDDPGFIRLATVISDQADHDPAFADALVANLTTHPVIGLIAAVAPYPHALTISMLDAAFSVTSYVDDRTTRLDAAAIEALLRSLLDDPAAVLQVLDQDAVRELVTWPFIDPTLAGDVLLTGLVASVDAPERLGDAHDVLRHLVTVANDPFVDRTTWPGPIAAAVAAGVAVQFPSFVTSLEPGDRVNLKDLDGLNFGPPLGEYEEVLDLLGALLRDPDAATTLLASLQPLAAHAATGTSHIDLADVGDLAVALANAAENESIEDRLHAAAVRSLVQNVTVMVGIATGIGAATLAFGPTARALLAQLVDRSGAAVADAAAPDTDSGTTPADAAAAGEIMIEIGVYEAFLAEPGSYVDTSTVDHAALDDVRRSLDEVRRAAEEGATLTDLEAALENVHVHVVRAGGGALVAALDVGSVAALDLHDAADADLIRPRG